MTQTNAVDADMEAPPIEPEDFDWIVLRYQKQIYRVLLFLVRDADTAETLTQECFLRAFRKRASFRGESSLSTWLVRIAINLANDHNRNRRWAFWRRLTRTDQIDTMRVPDGQRSPEQALIHSELMHTVQSAVENLSQRQRTVFLLRFVEDMPLAAIAEATGLEVGTVKTHLFRAIEAIKSACAAGNK